MLDETLVIWGGRIRPNSDGAGEWARSSIKGFSIWMAGGGIKGGITHGESDDLGYNAVKDIVHVHDLHATMLNQLGIDHKKLTFKISRGAIFRLTDVHAIW